jgi:NADH-quinone oxidoreductase subunit N
VPFHFWAPDTYEGSPVPVAAFLSVASKAAGFAGLIALMFFGFAPLAAFWAPVFAVLSILTMTIGNLVALQQRQVVRLLAYSSIAQAGYMLLPFALAGVSPEVDQQAVRAAIFYILVYAIMNLGAFAVVVAMAREAPGILVSDFAGMGRRAPAMAVAMLMFFVSLAGIPPTPGFWGKFFIFQAAIAADQAWLAVVMVVNSVISVWYYFSVIRPMFFLEPESARPFRAPALVTAVVVLASAAVVVLGVLPGIITGLPSAVTLP